MRTLILSIAILTLGNAHAATGSNDCFKKQVAIAQQNVSSHDFSGNVKALNAGIKSCRDIAKKEKLQEQIKKLQAKLSLTK